MHLLRNSMKHLAISACLMACAVGQAAAESHQTCDVELIRSESSISNLVGSSVSSEALDDFLLKEMKARNIPGLSIAVINDARVVYHQAMGVQSTDTGTPLSPCSVFQGASITKPLFGFFVMTFVEDGSLDLDRPLFEYLPHPDLEHDPRYKQITARMVLSHQTGLPNWRSDLPERQLNIAFDPGRGFSYSGEAYQYLAQVLMRIASVDDAGLEQLFQTRIAKPLGLERTQIIADQAMLDRRVAPHFEGEARHVRNPETYKKFGAAYGVHSEAADFSNWLIGLMKGEVLTPESYTAYFAAQETPVPNDGSVPIVLSQDYSLGFLAFDTLMGRLYGHNGNNPGFSSAIVLEKDRGWGFVLFANGNQTSDLGIDLALFLNTPQL